MAAKVRSAHCSCGALIIHWYDVSNASSVGKNLRCFASRLRIITTVLRCWGFIASFSFVGLVTCLRVDILPVEMIEGILSHLLGALLTVCQCCTPFEVPLYGHSVVPESPCKFHFRAVLQKDCAIGLGVCFIHILLQLLVTNAESNRGTWKTIKP